MKKIILSLLCISALKADTFLDDYQRLVETGDGQGINLNGLEVGSMLTTLSKKHKNGLNLSHANLEKTFLYGHDLTNVNFKSAQLNGAKFVLGSLKSCNFEGSQLSKTKFHENTGSFLNFTNTLLNKTSFRDNKLRDTKFDKSFKLSYLLHNQFESSGIYSTEKQQVEWFTPVDILRQYKLQEKLQKKCCPK